MKKFFTPLFLFTLVFALSAQERFDRSGIIPAAVEDVGGFGHLVAGVDLDGDGNQEIYAVNTDWHDLLGLDLVPRIYKYEKGENGQWQTVWSTRLPLEFQNTWSPLAVGDLDNDGKGEIIWGPVNNFGGGSQPNPPRIVVFETPGDGSDHMGVDNGDGTWRPNAQWTIIDADNVNLRPFKWIVTDIDGDGTQEIVSSIRAGSVGMQIYSVSDVPDAADSTETWTLEFEGLSGTHWDIAVIGNTAYGIRDNGDVTPVSATGPDTYVQGATQAGLVGLGSWKSATTIDADGDSQEEIIVASWSSSDNDVYLLQQSGDSLTSTKIADVPAESFRSYGGAAGDLDNDGNVDFVFGTRQSTPNGIIHRLEYQGGAIDDPANWHLSVLDAEVSPAVQYDIIGVGNLDDDADDEVAYSGIPRGLASTQPPQPIVVLDRIPSNQPIIHAVVDVPNDQGRQVWVVWEGAADDVAGMRFTAHLSGDNEVPPVVTAASGKATFILNEDETALRYLLEVNNIDSVTAAHIHVGAIDANGPVVVGLFAGDAGGPVNGILSGGVIRADEFGGDFAGLINDLKNGNLYVNVHSTQHPAGEIRGQILTNPITIMPRSGFNITHYVVWRIDGPGLPVQVAEVQAIQSPLYAAVVPTLGDGEEYVGHFVVSAHTDNVHVLWKSFPKAGISEDNLIPTAPGNIAATVQDGQVQLSWDESPDPDFNFFTVYRSTEAGFDPLTQGEVAGNTTDPLFVDANVQSGETWYYRVAATDFNNNLGEFSAEVFAVVTGITDGAGLPRAFALEQNYPNPFNPSTTIRYALKDNVPVRLKIYNTLGQVVRTLVNTRQQAGSYEVLWDGTNDFGQQVASGMYIYRIEAGDFVQAKRMTLLK